MAPKGPVETPRQCFERLRQAFDVIKEKHTDPWNWHEYLGPEPDLEPKKGEGDEFEDPEVVALRPKPASNVDRVKIHLLACTAELNRAAHAADMAYFHMCVSPDDMRECCKVLGTSADIDEDMLEESGDASPAKIMALLQKKLDSARDKINELEGDIRTLQENLQDERGLSQQRWISWQNTCMTLEERTTKLHWTSVRLEEALDREDELNWAYDDLHLRHVRASRIMQHKGRELMRDKIFKGNPKENLFYAYFGFMYILQREKDERKRREEEARRDAVEFALRNEVRFMLGESVRVTEAVERLVCETGRLKIDRKELACRILYKHRPHEPLEYLLWVWELWQPIRRALMLEKLYEREQASHAAVVQQLIHTSSQLPPAALAIDSLKQEVALVRVEKDVARREITLQGARQIARLVDELQEHRYDELAVLARLHILDTEEMKERIAVLEREIAEDAHVASLKGMVVDLESRLRRALDRRKQKSFVVPPGKSNQKCVQCGRESLFRSWKVMSAAAEQQPLGALQKDAAPEAEAAAPLAPLAAMSPPAGKEDEPSLLPGASTAWAAAQRKAAFGAVWR